MNVKNLNYEFFETNALERIITDNNFELIIIFDSDEINQIKEYCNQFSVPIIFISNTKDKIHEINTPLIYFLNENHLNPNTLVNKIYQLTLYKDFDKIIDQVLDDTDISVIIFNEQRKIVFINAPFTKQTGFEKKDLLGKSMNLLQSDEHSIMFYDNMFETVKNNLKWTGQIKIKRKDNTSFWEECIIKPLIKYDHKQYYVFIALNRNDYIVNNEIYKQEIEMAVAIQNSILPKPIKTERIAITGSYYPLNKISGDTYHWESLDDHKYIVLLCDVLGHGIASALVTTVISSIVRDLKSEWTTSEAFLKDLNNSILDLLSQNEKSQDYYFTAIFLEIDTLEKTLKYFNCGHPPVYYFNKDSLNKLHIRNFPIGLFKNYEFKSNTINYDESTELLLYSDGLKDLDMDYDSGLNILETVLRRYTKDSSDLLTHIEQEYLEHYFDKVNDDITLISIELF